MRLFDRIDRRLALPGDDETLIAQKRLGWLVMGFAAIMTTLFGLFGLLSANPVLGRHLVWSGLACLLAAVLLWNFPRWWPPLIAVFIVLLGTVDPLYGHMVSGGYTAGSYEIVWAFIGPVLAVLFTGRRMILFTTFLAAAAFIAGALLDPIALARAPQLSYGQRLFNITSNLIVLLAFTVAASLYLFSQIRRARRRADDLLLNILPAPIARRLKASRDTIADGFDEATILFADIVNFTAMSAGADPIAIVNKLNDIFTDFDDLARRHGLEKIKTIGDAYMVAGGLPNPRPDHAAAVVEFARDLLDVAGGHTSWTGESIHLRVGINSGPVVAGVIGRDKFIYDLWGDAVNVASRMEANGLANRIQVTAAVKERLDGRYRFAPRGPIDIKGKGEMMVYVLEGEE
jgi:class 3 adenylate cyclase